MANIIKAAKCKEQQTGAPDRSITVKKEGFTMIHSSTAKPAKGPQLKSAPVGKVKR